MYSDAFCKVYTEFGWNYFPEAFGQQLLQWMEEENLPLKESLDLACGTGVLCRVLSDAGLSARGMDFSSGMIHIAREQNPHIPFDVADMITYCPPAVRSGDLHRRRSESHSGHKQCGQDLLQCQHLSEGRRMVCV